MSNQETNALLGVDTVVWDLGDCYAGPRDPAISRDVARCELEAENVGKEFSGRVAELDPARLAALVARLERLDSLLGRLSTYAFLHYTTQTDNGPASALRQRIEELSAYVGRATVFFELEWNQVETGLAEQRLQHRALAPYRHHLANISRHAPHQLSRPEEELLRDLEPVGRSAWMTLFDKVMANMRFGPDGRVEEELLTDLHHQDRDTRARAAAELTEGLRTHGHILTHVFNTMAADKMIDDRLRRYPSWDQAMHLGNELGAATVDALIGAVISRYDVVQRYYGIKRELLGLDELRDHDRYAPIPGLGDEWVDWPRCRAMVLDSLRGFSPRMADIGGHFFERGWIHAPVLPGKRGGAFAHPCVPEVHPYLMVNYTGKLRDVATVAHELGHGIHQYLAREQGYYNSDTPLVLAETASIFGEMLVFQSQLGLIRDQAARRAFICQKIESIIATVFRQVSMNRFEYRMHRGRRERGELDATTLGEFWMATQREMFGDSVQLSENYALWWSYIPHFLATPGYVYSYAFGELLVLGLYARYRETGGKFVPKYVQLLASGGSASPHELLRPFDVDLDDPEFWHGGLRIIDKMVSEIA